MNDFKIGDRVISANDKIGYIEEIYETDPRVYIVRIDKETKYKAIGDHLTLAPEEKLETETITLTKEELENILNEVGSLEGVKDISQSTALVFETTMALFKIRLLDKLFGDR